MEKQLRPSIRNVNALNADINENLNETGKSSKRVSFSSRNRVKTFVKGSETTQWDLTYEEAINLTQSSHEIINKTPEEKTPKCENNSNDSTEPNQIEKEQSTDVDHANQTLLNIESLSMDIEEIDRTTEIYTHQPIIVIDKENLPIMINKGSNEMEITCQKEQTIFQSINKMEKTCQNTIKNPDISDMEFTCQIKTLPNNSIVESISNKIDKVITCHQIKSDKSQVEKENFHFSPDDMEFTCQLPNSVIKSALNKTEMELTCQQLETTNESEIESNKINMEFTCQLPNSTMNSSVTKYKTEMELTCQQFKRIDEADFESNKTDMDFTCQLPNFTRNSLLKSELNKTEMELTCQQSKKIDETDIKSNKTEMELTCQQNKSDKSTYCTPNKRQTIFSIRTDTICNNLNNSKENISLHCNKTGIQKNIDRSNIKTDDLSSESEDVNQQSEAERKQQPSYCQYEKDDKFELENVEFTCQLPSFTSALKSKEIRPSNDMGVNRTDNKIDMELTCQLEKTDKSIQENYNEMIKLAHRLSNSVTIKANVEKRIVSADISEKSIEIQKNHDNLLKEDEMNLTESKFTDNRSEILQQQQNYLDSNDDIEDMEWSATTPQKSIRKSIVEEENTRKRSLLSSFIPFDSPQIIKKPTKMKFITPDGKKKSNIPTPISSGKSKKKKITQSDEEHLDFLPIVTTTTTTPKSSVNENKKILYSQKIDKNFEKYDLTYIKTPDRSGMKIMSPCIDDTQQLIDATITVTLPEPSISINKTTSMNKLPEIEITLPSTSCTQLNIDDNYDINDTTASLRENHRFKNINNTFVLNKLSNHNHNDSKDKDDVYIDDCSIELVKSFDDSKTTINNSDISDEYDYPLARKFLENVKIKPFRCELIPLPTINLQRKQKYIDDFIENFEFQRFNVPSVEDVDRLTERLRNELKKKSENNSIIEISDSVNNEPALEEKIRTLGRDREEGIWELLESNNNLYKFNIVFSKLVLTVELNPDNENVANFTIDIAKQEKITNLLIYIHKAIKQKLNISNVQSSLGQSYDLIAFLQYIEMVIERFISFIKEFTMYGFYDPIFDEHGWLSFKIRNADKMKFFTISVNMLNLENLIDDDIKITFKFGDCDVKKLNKIVKKCSKLSRFLRNLIKSTEEYCV